MSEPFTAVTVWLLPLTPPPSADVLSASHALLDEEELTRASRFLYEPARVQFVLAHAAMRMLLSSVSPILPSDWRFERGVNGKPQVAHSFGATVPHFNLSHTDGLIACAVSIDKPIGIDVELIRPAVALRDYARLLSDAERDELEMLDGFDQARRFYAIWTAKEAYAKATGSGISEALRGVTIKDAEFAPRLIGGDPFVEQWRLHRLDSTPDHHAVIAITGDAIPNIRHITAADLFTR